MSEEMTDEEYDALSDDEKVKAFLAMMMEYRETVSPEQYEAFVGLLEDSANGKLPSYVAARVIKH